jgi:hypothetical protein
MAQESKERFMAKQRRIMGAKEKPSFAIAGM